MNGRKPLRDESTLGTVGTTKKKKKVEEKKKRRRRRRRKRRRRRFSHLVIKGCKKSCQLKRLLIYVSLGLKEAKL